MTQTASPSGTGGARGGVTPVRIGGAPKIGGNKPVSLPFAESAESGGLGSAFKNLAKAEGEKTSTVTSIPKPEISNETKVVLQRVQAISSGKAGDQLKAIAGLLPGAGETAASEGRLSWKEVPNYAAYKQAFDDAKGRYKQTFDPAEFNKNYQAGHPLVEKVTGEAMPDDFGKPEATPGPNPEEEIIIKIPGTSVPFPHGVPNPDRPLFTDMYTMYVRDHPDLSAAGIDLEEIRRMVRDEKIRRAQPGQTGALNTGEKKPEENKGQEPIILGPAPEEKKKEPIKPEDELSKDKKTEETPNGEKKQEQQLTEEQKAALKAEATEIAKRYPEEMQEIILQTRNVRDAARYRDLFKKTDADLAIESVLVDVHVTALQESLKDETLEEWELRQIQSDLVREKIYKQHIERVQRLSQDKTKEGERKKAEEETTVQRYLQMYENQQFEAIQKLENKVSPLLVEELRREAIRIPELESIIKHGVTVQHLKEGGLDIFSLILQILFEMQRSTSRTLASAR